MSAGKDIVVVSFHEKVEAAIAGGMDPRRFMELMMVDYIKEWAGEKGLVSISDGETTIQCLVNNPSKERPKNKKK